MVSGMNNPPTSEDLRTLETIHSENRTLRWKARQLGKQSGRQGRTIFALRNEVAALREGLKVHPGDYTRLLTRFRSLQEENQRLREKLAAKQPKKSMEDLFGPVIDPTDVDA